MNGFTWNIRQGDVVYLGRLLQRYPPLGRWAADHHERLYTEIINYLEGTNWHGKDKITIIEALRSYAPSQAGVGEPGHHGPGVRGGQPEV